MSAALLLGGTSEIGLAIVRRLAPEHVWLLGRDKAALDHVAAGMPGARTGVLDADDVDSHRALISSAFAEAGGFDVVVLAVGVLGAQAGLAADRQQAAEVMRVNFLGAGSLLLESLRELQQRAEGALVVLSSAAVERPRASNAIYGAAKAGLDALAQGLSDALADSDVRVLVVRPGFVKTRMTAGLPAAPFATTPDVVAAATVAALGGRAHTIWVPGRLRVIFALGR